MRPGFLILQRQEFLGFTVAKICIFEFFVLLSWAVHTRAHRGEGRKESGPNIPVRSAWGNFGSLQKFFADLGVVEIGFAKSNIRCPWPSESWVWFKVFRGNSGFSNTGLSYWLSTLGTYWRVRHHRSFQHSPKDLGKGGSKRKSSLWAWYSTSIRCLSTFYSKRVNSFLPIFSLLLKTAIPF